MYVAQPEILNDVSRCVWKLNKTFDGLKQAATAWHKELARLSRMNFYRSAADPADAQHFTKPTETHLKYVPTLHYINMNIWHMLRLVLDAI